MMPDITDKTKLLGISMYNFMAGETVTDELMELQCEYSLKWMKEGRLDGMIFACNATMGVGLSSEKWLCEWVDRVKYKKVPDYANTVRNCYDHSRL